MGGAVHRSLTCGNTLAWHDYGLNIFQEIIRCTCARRRRDHDSSSSSIHSNNGPRCKCGMLQDEK